MVTSAIPEHPDVVPVTVYMVDEVGVAVGDAHVVQESPAEGDQK